REHLGTGCVVRGREQLGDGWCPGREQLGDRCVSGGEQLGDRVCFPGRGPAWGQGVFPGREQLGKGVCPGREQLGDGVGSRRGKQLGDRVCVQDGSSLGTGCVSRTGAAWGQGVCPGREQLGDRVCVQDGSSLGTGCVSRTEPAGDRAGGSDVERTKKKRRGDRYSVQTSLIVEDPSMRWQMALYKETSGKAEDAEDPEKVVKRVQEVSSVLYHIEVTEHPYKSKKMVWHKLLSKQRRKAVVACFRMHRGSNMFLNGYKRNWLQTEGYQFEDRMIDDLSELCLRGRDEEAETKPDPLHQLILHFSRTALTEKSKLEVDYLYMAYADIMAKEKEMEKQRLLYQQSRLHNRGAAEMVLQMISACRGETGSMVCSTLKLGISILNTGNCDVQQVSSVIYLVYLVNRKQKAGVAAALLPLLYNSS
ncbi:unnamed protein product, partial [Coregonus sp. 'balchen']